MTTRPWRTWTRRAGAGILTATLSVLILGSGYLGASAIRHTRPVSLPAPSGHYPVGRTTFEWTDTLRADLTAPQPRRPRELSVWLWYPASPHPDRATAPYAPGAWGQLHLAGVPGLGETNFNAIRTHSYTDTPVAAGRFPVAVFEPGLGFAAPQYTTLAENLASHGYLVAGVTPTYSANLTVLHAHPVHATAAGKPSSFDAVDVHAASARRHADQLVAQWATDARFAAARVIGLDRAGPFAGHLDPAHTTYLGHSFGGAASLEACRRDPHCAGAADLDGTQFGTVVHAGLDRPALILGSQNSCVTGVCRAGDAGSRGERTAARTLLAASAGRVWRYEIEGSGHLNFSDYGAYWLAAPLRRLLGLGDIDGGQALRIAGAYLAAFLDHTVRGRAEPLLAGTSAPYRQVRAVGESR